MDKYHNSLYVQLSIAKESSHTVAISLLPLLDASNLILDKIHIAGWDVDILLVGNLFMTYDMYNQSKTKVSPF